MCAIKLFTQLLDLYLCKQLDSTHRSEEHTSELQSLRHLVCRLLLEKKELEVLGRAVAAHGEREAVVGGQVERNGTVCDAVARAPVEVHIQPERRAIDARLAADRKLD